MRGYFASRWVLKIPLLLIRLESLVSFSLAD